MIFVETESYKKETHRSYSENMSTIDLYPIDKQTTNPKAIDAVLNCDILIISTGTFWSSIHPTLIYDSFYKHIEQSTAAKFLFVNNACDHDVMGSNIRDVLY